jgi:Kef-type K+ transport system membrane component KefB
MHNEFQLIIVLSTLLLIAPFVSNILKLPIIVTEIMLGSVAEFLGILPHNHLFELIAEVGFLYLMFLAGMEVNLRELFKTDRKILLYSGLFLLLLYILSVFSVYIFDLSKVFLATLPLISVGIIVTLQKEIGKKEWLSLAMTVGVLGELVSIMILTILSGVFTYGVSVELYKAIFILVGFLSILAIGYFILKSLFWWFPKIKHYLMPNNDKYNQDIRISFAIFFILIAIMMYLKLDVVLGAFVAGMFIASFFYHNIELEHKLSPFGFGFLITIFFIHVGSGFDLKMLINEELIIKTIFILFIMISIRLLSSFIFSNLIGRKESILLGLSLSMPLTLLIATATVAYNGKSIDLLHYNAFVLASILEVIIVMLLIKLFAKQNPLF